MFMQLLHIVVISFVLFINKRGFFTKWESTQTLFDIGRGLTKHPIFAHYLSSTCPVVVQSRLDNDWTSTG
jgi:hypothetical protein